MMVKRDRKAELVDTMTMCGAHTLAEIDVYKRQPVTLRTSSGCSYQLS